MYEAILLSVFNVSKLVKEMKTMIPDLTAMSENIMKIRKKAYEKIKKVRKINNNLNFLKVSKKWIIILTCLNSVSSHLRSNHLRSNHPRSHNKNLFGLLIKVINLSLEELKIIAKFRKVKDKKYKPKDELMEILSEPEPKISTEKIKKNLMNSEISQK